jgi:hypothetical protein
MASTFSSVEVTRGDFRYNEKGVYALYGTYELAAALVINDVIKMVNIKSGTKVLHVMLFVDGLDTGTSLVLDVGDDGDTDRFITGSVIGRSSTAGQIDSLAATYGNKDGFAYEYTADNTIDVKVQTAPASGASTGTVTLVALVSNDIND